VENSRGKKMTTAIKPSPLVRKNILAFSVLCMVCLHFTFAVNIIQKENHYYTVKQLKDDFRQMRKAVERHHPAIYEFTDKKTFTKLFDQQFAEIDRPMNGLEFYRIAAPLIARIGCGHSRLFTPTGWWNRIPNKFFPLGLIFLNGKAYVKRDYSKSGKIPKGSEVLTINGLSLPDIKKVLKAYISADG
jgi:hypothetical protein